LHNFSEGTHGTNEMVAYDRALERIRQGFFPAPTTPDQLQWNLHFNLTEHAVNGESDSRRRQYNVEVFDFPGNLLISSSPDNEAVEDLNSLLQQAEGFLLLFEVGSGTEKEESRQAIFRRLLLERVLPEVGDRSVAILLTKWDRICPAIPPLNLEPGAWSHIAADPAGEARRWLCHVVGGARAEAVSAWIMLERRRPRATSRTPRLERAGACEQW
jgi:hypothetical protein